MADPQTLGGLAKLAGSLASLAGSKAKRLWAERSAGKAPLAPRQALLDKGFSATLSRLTRGDIEDSWWRRLWDGVGHPMITPDFLAAGEVQVWLQDPNVQADIKHLTRAALLETQEPLGARTRLQDLYSKITSGYHNAVSMIKNLFSVFYTFSILNFCNDFGITIIFIKYFLDINYILLISNK